MTPRGGGNNLAQRGERWVLVDKGAGSQARTLVVYGDRDPLYPVEMGVAMYRAIPNSALWVVPGGGHGPVFFAAAEEFATKSLEFLKG